MFRYTPYLLPLFLSAIVLFGLVIFAWHYRTRTAAIPFGFMMVGAIIWVVAAILEVAATELQLRLFIADLSFIGIAPLAAIWLVLVIEYTGRTHRMKRLIYVVFAVPIVTNILIWTNDFHHLWRGGSTLDTVSAPFPITVYNYNFWFFWVHAPSGYIIFIVSFILLVRSLLFASLAYRRQIMALLIALILPILVDTLYVFGISPIPNFNFTPIVFSISGIIIGWSLFRYKFLDLMPVARDAIVQSMDDIVIVLDEKHRIVDVNPALQAMINRDVSEIIGLHISDAFPKHYENIERHMRAGDSRLEIVVDENSVPKHFNVHISPLYNGQHKIGELIVMRDVTEAKRLEQQQILLKIEQQRIQALHQFISDATHDVMTPISVMKSSLYVARKTQDENQRKKKLSLVETELNHLQQMLQDMLLMAKLDTMSSDDLSRGEIDFNHLLQAQIEKYHQIAESKNQQLIFDLSPQPIMLCVQEDLIAVALSQLLDNAVKYTDENGIITIVAKIKNQHIEITISDTGDGINAVDLTHIFERFYRVQSHRPMDSGSGLGLSLTRQIIELHHGHIEVESSVGQGSTFKIILPIEQHSHTTSKESLLKESQI